MTWDHIGWTEYPCDGEGLPVVMYTLGRFLYESWAECGDPPPARVFIRGDEIKVERTLEEGAHVVTTDVVAEDDGARLRIWDGWFGDVIWIDVGDPKACDKLFQRVVASLAVAAMNARFPDPDRPA